MKPAKHQYIFFKTARDKVFLSLTISLFMTAAITALSSPAQADARTAYLINMLQNGSSYRVKVQAAESLGRLKSSDALPALVNALNDKSGPVVIAAAAALQDIGDPQVLPQLKKAKKKQRNRAVKSQINAAIKTLMQVDAGTPVSSTALTRYLVKVDDMGNSSSSKRDDITRVMKKIVTDALLAKGSIEIQPAGMSVANVQKKLKTSGKKAFIVSGSLIKLQKEQNFIVVNITLNVFSNPDYNLVMMPAGEIKVPAGQGTQTKQIEERAIRRLVDNLIGKILEAAPNVL